MAKGVGGGRYMAKGGGEVLMQNCQKYSKEERLYPAVTESSFRQPEIYSPRSHAVCTELIYAVKKSV